MTWGAPTHLLREGVVKEEVEADSRGEAWCTLEQDHLETMLGLIVGYSQNMGQERENATHVANRDTTRLNVGPETLKAARRWVLGVHSWSIHDFIDSMSVNERVSTADDCNNVRVTFSDTVTNDDVGMERGSVVPVHPSTESNRGNSVIFSAEVYDHCEGFSDRYVLLDTCAGESVFKSKNMFYFTESSPTPMIISGVNPKGKPLIITECGETDFGFVYYDPKCIADILSFGNDVNNSVLVVYNHRHDCYVV
jgi:hypothetical protein